MEPERKESTLTTVLWTVGSLAIVLGIAVYLGMN